MPTSPVLPIFTGLVGALEVGGAPTAFNTDNPGLSPLPPDLGSLGAPPAKVVIDLADRHGFLTIFRAKAAYFGLPIELVTTVRDEIRPLWLYWDRFMGDATARTRPYGPLLNVQLAETAPRDLWRAYAVGNRSGAPPPIINDVYHELSHVWMYYFESRDPYWEQVADRSIAYYRQNSPGVNAWVAYMEAAGSYVDQRVSAWNECLLSLNAHWASLQDGAPDVKATKDFAAESRDTYNTRLKARIYGTAEGVALTVEIPKELRQAVDVHLLESSSLTKEFSKVVPLVRLFNAIQAY